MKLMSLALLCIAIALVVSACTETAQPANTNTARTAASPAAATATPDPLARAQVNFTKNCEPCHGPTGEGGLVKVENKQIKVPSLKADHAIKHSDDQITKMITNGEEAMPAFKDKMSAQEIADMVKFVRSHFQGK
jgi:mono/diheme cytochrome c family protein